VKSSYRFEIVRRKSDRFGWRVVAIDDVRRRVLGRSERSYPSRKKAKKAIDALRVAYVDDTTRPRDGFPLPTTRFEVVPGVLPLIVAEGPVEYSLAARRRGDARAEKDATPEEAAQAQTAVQTPLEESAAQESAAQESAAETTGKARLGRRAKKTE
jgi:hypothetical protein